MEEKYRYYVVFAFISDTEHLRIACRYIDFKGEVETSRDISDLEDALQCPFSGVTIINWKRIS